METVDVLTTAVDAARMIRSASDPEAVLREACRLVGCPPGETAEPLSVRVVRLVERAENQRRELHDFLSAHKGPLYLNRHPEGKPSDAEAVLQEADPEALALLEYVESEDSEDEAVNLLEDMAGPYSVGSRKIVRFIDRSDLECPKVVRGLIDYPLEVPVLFSIDLKSDMWQLWDIFTAFSDQYFRIYEQPERFGVWGHDLNDLWIEQLFYYPEKQLIYPFIGS